MGPKSVGSSLRSHYVDKAKSASEVRSVAQVTFAILSEWKGRNTKGGGKVGGEKREVTGRFISTGERLAGCNGRLL
jgi:hypothetical protein